MLNKSINLKLLIIFLAISLTGCGISYEEGEVPASINVIFNEIKFPEEPVTIPVKPGEKITLFAALENPPARRYQRTDLQMELYLNDKFYDTAEDSFVITISDTTEKITIKAQSRWQVDEPGQKTHYLKDSHSFEIYPAIARQRPKGQNTINGYTVGTFPDISGDYSLWQDNLVIINSNIPFEANGKQADQLDYGTLVEPVKSNGEIIRKNNKLQVIHNNQRGWIPVQAVNLPHSVKLFPQIYEEPRWYYPVTENNRAGFVLPGITWAEFDHDEYYRESLNSQLPHYIALDRDLITELHHLRAELHRRGYPSRIRLICGTRNPHYNQGEREKKDTLKALYSRHQYGDAIDLIVDSSRSRRMDDINGDGRISIEDADRLAEIAEKIRTELGFKGGIGTYSRHDIPERIQSPYLHLDLRGLQAKWRITE